jgi:hypothetical protein
MRDTEPTSGGETETTYLSGVSPELKSDGAYVEPIATIRLGGTIPWKTESKQLQCGETVIDNSGEMTHRLNMEAVVSHTQFKTLMEMRTSSSSVKLVSAGYTGTVTFDQLKWDQVEDANGAVINGKEVNEPIYKVQLQSKQNENSG